MYKGIAKQMAGGLEAARKAMHVWVSTYADDFVEQEAADDAAKVRGTLLYISNIYDEIAHALSAYNSIIDVEGEDGWMPIETAPKDGTEILAARPDSNDISIVYWADDAWLGACDGEPSVASRCITRIDYHEPFVTKWQPLPNPPKAKT